MLDWLMRYWLEVAFGLLTAGAGILWRKLIENSRRQSAMENGIQALLRDRLVQAYYHYTEKGFITLHGMESVEKMYEEYHNLGGNGTVTKLFEDMKEYPIKDDKAEDRRDDCKTAVPNCPNCKR